MEKKDFFPLPAENIGTDFNYKHKIIWKNVFVFVLLHILCVYAYYLYFIGIMKSVTFWWHVALGYISGLGITVGAHRYYTHRTFKAKPILQVIFIICHTISGQNTIFGWAQDHRLHHRYSDTDGDPHNSRRGFFFSHIGWLMARKNPRVKELGKRIDIADLLADPLVVWQRKHNISLHFFLGFLLPAAVPVLCFGGSWSNSVLASIGRYMTVLHFTCLVNSVAHLCGTERPYDKGVQPVESWFVSLVTSGEGWHNYHHTFPWDYKAAEDTMPLNFSATLIRFFERIGWAYDLKIADHDLMQKRILRTGDGHHTSSTEKSDVIHDLMT